MNAETMLAAGVDEFGPASALTVSRRPVPEPGPGEISIDVTYAGVGFVDTLLRSGAFPLWTPMVPGIEVTGRVRAVGRDVQGFTVGRSVAALLNDFGRGQRAGGYAQVAVAHHTMAAPVPDGVDLRRVTAALVNGVTAWVALHDVARLDARDRVLVLGVTGGLGATTARMATLFPARQVIGVVGRDPDRAPDECTDVVVADALPDALDRLTPDGSVDVVIDPVGGPLRAAAFRRLAPFGRHVVLGNASRDDRPFSGDETWLATRTVSGLSIGGVTHLRPATCTEALTAVISLVARGILDEPLPAVEPLENAGKMHEALESRTAPAKTVLSVAD
ncbi:zinc-binding dehydrogenase [Streptomyces sp. NPDC005373]|uniref:quinone oxidoreductase family protein n=1 Tax=unclassified Streptomyces TaxID=2593676 RepID=UPI0033B32784